MSEGMTYKHRAKALERIAIDLHWMARRYVDGRSSYAPALFNGHVEALLALGVTLKATCDETIWAKDGRGRTPGRRTAREELADKDEAPLGTKEVLEQLKDEGFSTYAGYLSYLLRDKPELKPAGRVGGQYLWLPEDLEPLRAELRKRGKKGEPKRRLRGMRCAGRN